MKEHFNELSPAEAERLALLAEECAEVVQAVAKILRHGYDSVDPTTKDSPTNQKMLERECGDVLAAMRMMWERHDIDLTRCHQRADEKAEKVRKWLHHQESRRV